VAWPDEPKLLDEAFALIEPAHRDHHCPRLPQVVRVGCGGARARPLHATAVAVICHMLSPRLMASVHPSAHIA
jgi:hypothetical protein